MIHTLTILDDFLPNPWEARHFGLSHDFTQAPEFQGHRYEHFAPVADEKFTAWVADKLSAAIGLPVRVNIATFTRLMEGETTQQWIHADNPCSGHAAVIYLFEGHHEHGTSFWLHPQLGSVQPAEVSAELAESVRAIGNDPSAWRELDRASAAFNRCIFYPASRFHSRTQRFGFGATPEDSRLTLALFFDILTPDPPAQ